MAKFERRPTYDWKPYKEVPTYPEGAGGKYRPQDGQGDPYDPDKEYGAYQMVAVPPPAPPAQTMAQKLKEKLPYMMLFVVVVVALAVAFDQTHGKSIQGKIGKLIDRVKGRFRQPRRVSKCRKCSKRRRR